MNVFSLSMTYIYIFILFLQFKTFLTYTNEVQNKAPHFSLEKSQKKCEQYSYDSVSNWYFFPKHQLLEARDNE